MNSEIEFKLYNVNQVLYILKVKLYIFSIGQVLNQLFSKYD